MAPIRIDPATDSLSYWHATAEPYVPAAALPATAEAVVIGGGLLGCWTAYWLAMAGVPVVLLERTAIGWGATGRNGGFLVGGTAMSYASLVDTVGREGARHLYRLTLEGRDLAYAVVAGEGIDCDLRQAGTLSLALGDERLTSMARSRALLREDGFELHLLDRQGVRDFLGIAPVERIVGGTFAERDGVLHSSRYVAGIARAAERHGARLVQAAVTAITPQGQTTRIDTSAGTIEAGAVVIAVNAWSDTLVPGLAGVIVPTRGQILAYEPSAPVFRTAVGVDLTPTGEYWQQRPDGTIVIGGCRADAPGADVGVREMAPTPKLTSRIENILPQLFPELGALRVARRWAGPMAFTRDYLPVAGEVPGLERAWMAGGFSGHGMTFGPRIAQLLAQSVTSGVTADSLLPLRLDRPTLASPDSGETPGDFQGMRHA